MKMEKNEELKESYEEMNKERPKRNDGREVKNNVKKKQKKIRKKKKEMHVLKMRFEFSPKNRKKNRKLNVIFIFDIWLCFYYFSLSFRKKEAIIPLKAHLNCHYAITNAFLVFLR